MVEHFELLTCTEELKAFHHGVQQIFLLKITNFKEICCWRKNASENFFQNSAVIAEVFVHNLISLFRTLAERTNLVANEKHVRIPAYFTPSLLLEKLLRAKVCEHYSTNVLRARKCVITAASCVKTVIPNNFCWLNAVKETKIVFFARDNSGDKILTAHAAGKIFSEVYLLSLPLRCSPFMVLSPPWKILHFGSENFSHPPSPVWASGLVGRYGRFAEACYSFGFSWLHTQVFPIPLVGHASCKCSRRA